MSVCVCLCGYVGVCLCGDVCVCLCFSLYVCLCRCVGVCVCVFVFVWVCMLVCLCVCDSGCGLQKGVASKTGKKTWENEEGLSIRMKMYDNVEHGRKTTIKTKTKTTMAMISK